MCTVVCCFIFFHSRWFSFIFIVVHIVCYVNSVFFSISNVLILIGSRLNYFVCLFVCFLGAADHFFRATNEHRVQNLKKKKIKEKKINSKICRLILVYVFSLYIYMYICALVFFILQSFFLETITRKWNSNSW